jgi:hypothetical protein
MVAVPRSHFSTQTLRRRRTRRRRGERRTDAVWLSVSSWLSTRSVVALSAFGAENQPYLALALYSPLKICHVLRDF